MARVIADRSKEIEKRVICFNCGAEIGYLPIDVQEKKDYDYTGDFDVVRGIKCPSCGKFISVR